MENNTASIVSRVWSFCNTLRDDGVGYGDYLEQLTYLIFLKMADEYSRPPYSREVGIPDEYNWQALRSRRGAELEVHYVTLLRELGKEPGMLGQIFTKAQSKIQEAGRKSLYLGKQLFRIVPVMLVGRRGAVGARLLQAGIGKVASAVGLCEPFGFAQEAGFREFGFGAMW